MPLVTAYEAVSPMKTITMIVPNPSLVVNQPSYIGGGGDTGVYVKCYGCYRNKTLNYSIYSVQKNLTILERVKQLITPAFSHDINHSSSMSLPEIPSSKSGTNMNSLHINTTMFNDSHPILNDVGTSQVNNSHPILDDNHTATIVKSNGTFFIGFFSAGMLFLIIGVFILASRDDDDPKDDGDVHG